MTKKTLIIGASNESTRYSFLAANKLLAYQHPIKLLGIKEGKVANQKIETEKKHFRGIDTVTLYINPRHQTEYFDYIANLKPRRVIFNPGTENIEFEDFLRKKGIEVVEACTLVMLSTKQY